MPLYSGKAVQCIAGKQRHQEPCRRVQRVCRSDKPAHGKEGAEHKIAAVVAKMELNIGKAPDRSVLLDHPDRLGMIHLRIRMKISPRCEIGYHRDGDEIKKALPGKEETADAPDEAAEKPSVFGNGENGNTGQDDRAQMAGRGTSAEEAPELTEYRNCGDTVNSCLRQMRRCAERKPPRQQPPDCGAGKQTDKSDINPADQNLYH